MADSKLARALPPDKCCFSDLKVVNFSYEWTVTNLIFRCNAVDELDVMESPTLSCSDLEAESLRWRLKLSVPAKQSEMVNVSLDLDSYHDVILINKFSLLGRNREILHDTNWSKPKRFNCPATQSTTTHSTRRATVHYELSYTQRFVSTVNVSLMAKSSLFTADKGFLPDGKLTIFCEISVHDISTSPIRANCTPKRHVARCEESPPPEVLDCDLSQQLGFLLETATLSDVTLAAGKEKFKAHKAILSARSPVFRAMFQPGSFKEQKKSFVQIEGHDPIVVKEMLTFIYTGEAPKLKEKAHDLFFIADMYELERLKQLCESELWRDINVKNVVDTLLLAMKHDLIQLKRKCTQFITDHIAEVMKTTEWEKLKSVNVELAEMFLTITGHIPTKKIENHDVRVARAQY